jgi:GNAT superfamily N-acetyltransferase
MSEHKAIIKWHRTQPDFLKGKYQVSTDKRRFNIALIHDFLRSSYWARSIPRSVVTKSIRNSLCFAVFHGREQVGFARVITDRATFAYLADVFVVPEHRGRGVGKMLVGRILAHRDMQGLRRILLSTDDAHGLYAPFGFKQITHPEWYMTIAFPGVYQKKNRHRRNPKAKRLSAP